ncbi:MAG TPA: DUF4294 domain-containing protein [Paludibacter sp.]|nr:DUF4294 domain-containing protein [Paludibacter sp.]
MTLTKKTKINLIAAIVTLFIHILLFGIISFDFSGIHSPDLSNSELDDLQIQLEDIPEDIFFTPPGNGPLTDRKDKESESITREKGPAKASQPALKVDPPAAEDLTQEITVDSDTVVKKIEVVQPILKVDSVKVIASDSDLVADLMKELVVVDKKQDADQRAKTEREKFQFYKKNYKNIRNFKKVYPYALRTKEIIDSLNMKLKTMSSESGKRKLINETEKRLFQQYETAVRTMSTSQGRLLLKLIARETNKTGYEIIKDYKGTLPATFWYGVGKIFGTDLKSQFDKQKEDSLIEDIVTKYKNNDLY